MNSSYITTSSYPAAQYPTTSASSAHYTQPQQYSQAHGATSYTTAPTSTYAATASSVPVAAAQGQDLSLTAQENTVVDAMCKRVISEGLGDRVTRDMVIQFLMARKFQEERAMALLHSHLNWKATNQIIGNQVPLTVNIIKELESGRFLAPPSRDLFGAQVVYFKPALLNAQITTNPQEFCVAVYYLLQRAIQDLRTQRLGFLFICDLRGTKMSHVDTKLVRTILDMLQNKFPGRLRKVLLLEPPKFFRMVFRLIRPLIAQKYLDKMCVTDMTELSKYIHPSMLLPEYGGSLQFDQRQFLAQLQLENSKQVSAVAPAMPAALPPSVFGIATS